MFHQLGRQPTGHLIRCSLGCSEMLHFVGSVFRLHSSHWQDHWVSHMTPLKWQYNSCYRHKTYIIFQLNLSVLVVLYVFCTQTCGTHLWRVSSSICRLQQQHYTYYKAQYMPGKRGGILTYDLSIDVTDTQLSLLGRRPTTMGGCHDIMTSQCSW